MTIDGIPATHLDEQDIQSSHGELPNQSTIEDETTIIDISCLTAQFPSNKKMEALGIKGPPKAPKMIPPDKKGLAIPINIFQSRSTKENEMFVKISLFCFP